MHPVAQLPLQCPVQELSQLSAHVLKHDPVHEVSQLSAHVLTQDPVQPSQLPIQPPEQPPEQS